jgi:serine protease Do
VSHVTPRKRARRLITVGVAVLGGLAAGYVLSLTVGSRSSTAFVLPSPSLAHAASGAPMLSVADVAERCLPSVVNIYTTRKSSMQASPFMMDPFFREFFQHFGPGRPSPRKEQALGSGVIVSADGVVVTNSHVVKDADKIRVLLADKREFKAKLVATDPKSDVAVLRLKGAKNLKPIRIGDSDKLRLGDVVVAIGNPFGVGQTVTMGIVSAKGRANMNIVDYEDFIQTDAAINPGNSGGALINMAGELVGINTAIATRTGGYQGIGFAIPTNMVQPIMKSLLARGRVVRGWLGVVIQEVNPELAKAMKLATSKGVLISDVDDSGPAKKAGLQRGDLVVRINGKAVDSTARLKNVIASAGPGANVKLELYRGKARQTLIVKLAELPAHLGGGPSAPRGKVQPQGSLGLTVEPLSRSVRQRYNISSRLKYGVAVTALDPSGPAAQSGLQTGDVILEVNRAKIDTVGRFSQILRAARGHILLLVYRQGTTLYMIIQR